MFQLISQSIVEIVGGVDGVIEGRLKEPTPFLKTSTKNKGAIALRVEHVAALFDWIDSTKGRPRESHDSETIKQEYDSFRFFDTFEQACDVYRNRPHEVRTFTELDIPLKSPVGEGNEIFYDVTGDFIDMGRFVEEQPECFGQNVMGNPRSLFATIVLNLNIPSSVSETAIRRRAERVVRLVDWLERQKIRCEILAFSITECEHIEIVVKQAHEPVNLDTVAVVGHPDFLRRVLFYCLELSPTWSYGYGTAASIRRGTLSLPPVDTKGLLVYSECRSDARELDLAFDGAEKEIETKLADGETIFSLHV